MTEKQCATGLRRYRSRKEAQQLAHSFEECGLTRQEFCRQNKVALNTLNRYLKRYSKEQHSRKESAQWLAVEIARPEQKGNSELTVVLRDELRIEVRRGFDAATLQQIVAALGRS